MTRIRVAPGAPRRLVAAWIVGFPLVACATGEEIHEGTSPGTTGGAPSNGGAGSAAGMGSGSGGGLATGGLTGAGGVSGTGGVEPSTGGEVSSGGSASGGSSNGGTSSGGAAMGGSTSGGTAGTGGAGTGGAKATGGTSSGGTSGTGGAKATGGTSSGGTSGTGGASTGGASTGGTGGAPGCADTDADGITDCDETDDSSTWTDPAIFNGLHVQLGNQCSLNGNCSNNDTLQEVSACMQGNIEEEKNQHAGWDWNDAPNSVCSSEYGFAPNWTRCDSSWAARWTGCIHFDTAGPHCFQITGGTNEACAALYFDGSSNADAQSGTAVKCFNVAAGNYPLLFHYTMDDGSSSGMHVRYCDAAGGSTCTPSAAIPSRMLRTACP